MQSKGYVPIHPLSLVPNEIAAANVFLWNDEQQCVIKFLDAKQVISEAVFSLFVANPYQKVFVADTEIETFQDHLSENMDRWLAETRVPRIVKTTLTAEILGSVISRAYARRSLHVLIQASFDCAERMVRYGRMIGICGREMHRSLRHDSSFPTHALNTGMLVYLIASRLGYSESLVVDMCKGALLHDVGKIDSDYLSHDPDITSFSSDWTDRSNKLHPIEGFRRLCHLSEISETQLMMCYQHHERIDGKGYPVGLLGNEIHEASRLCAVANRFDGLTSDRSNRTSISRMAALRVMNQEMNSLLDAEFFRCLDRIMSEPSKN